MSSSRAKLHRDLFGGIELLTPQLEADLEQLVEAIAERRRFKSELALTHDRRESRGRNWSATEAKRVASNINRIETNIRNTMQAEERLRTRIAGNFDALGYNVTGQLRGGPPPPSNPIGRGFIDPSRTYNDPFAPPGGNGQDRYGAGVGPHNDRPQFPPQQNYGVADRYQSQPTLLNSQPLSSRATPLYPATTASSGYHPLEDTSRSYRSPYPSMEGLTSHHQSRNTSLPYSSPYAPEGGYTTENRPGSSSGPTDFAPYSSSTRPSRKRR